MTRLIARYDGPIGGSDYAMAIAVSPDGTRVFVTGSSAEGFEDGAFATVAYVRSTGGQLWAARFSGYGSSGDVARSIAVSPDGSAVFVSGYSSATVTSAVTIAYAAATGSQVWIAKRLAYDGGSTIGPPLAVDPLGSLVYVSAYVPGGPNGADFDTIAYDAQTGRKVWSSTFSGPGSNYDVPNALAVSPDGTDVYVTASSFDDAILSDYWTVAYASDTGERLWTATYDDPRHTTDFPYAIGVSPNGSRVFVTGVGDLAFTTVAYDAATGTQRWVSTSGGDLFGGSIAHDLVVAPDGQTVYVSGAGGVDYGTFAYGAATGFQRWAALYSGGHGVDAALDMGISPDGRRIYVTGHSQADNGFYDIATLAYGAATGAQLAEQRYNGPGNRHDQGKALAVDPSGRWIYVTGNSYTDSDRESDYLTIAYGP